MYSNRQFFRENNGQVRDQNWLPRTDILFSGKSEGLIYHLKKDGLSYQFSRNGTWKQNDHELNHKNLLDQKKISPKSVTFYRVDVEWLGANPNCIIEKEGQLDGFENFYNVPQGTEPVLNVKSYSSIVYKNIYHNIDLKFYKMHDGTLKYDFIILPGGNYQDIQISIKGGKIEINTNQELIIKTPYGIITEGTLQVMQAGKILPSRWVINSENIISFDVNCKNNKSALIIDPPVRLWSTYYGGGDEDFGNGIDTDDSGNVVITGYTESTAFIATSGAHQTTLAGNWDVFLAKFNPNGGFLWGSYYGGNNSDVGSDILIDDLENIYVTGTTKSTILISTLGSHQQNHGDGGSIFDDAFLIKFDKNGNRLWGTYLGGNGYDSGHNLITDSAGNCYLSGYTTSLSNVSTQGAHQIVNGGGGDGFLAKFSPSGFLVWATYYGGSSLDYFTGISIDKHENIILSGDTESLSSIASIGSYQNTKNLFYDAFVVKFDKSGTRLWSTYYGGGSVDYSSGVTTDASSNIIITGKTESTTSIASPGAHQIMKSGYHDAFIVKFDSSGSRMWGTYYGGGVEDRGLSITADISDNIYVIGDTYSLTEIATSGTYQTNINGGSDAFIVKFNSAGIRIWGTYFGGINNDIGNDVVIDLFGNLSIIGTTQSTNSIGFVGSHQQIFGGGYDVFIGKFNSGTNSTDLHPHNEELYPILITPNPGKYFFKITGIDSKDINSLMIVNSMGQIIYHLKGNELIHTTNNVSLAQGIYDIRIETPTGVISKKWIVNY